MVLQKNFKGISIANFPHFLLILLCPLLFLTSRQSHWLISSKLALPGLFYSIGEPGRSASIPVGLQSKSRQKLSSSNPQLNATLTNEKPELLGCWEDDGEEITCEGSNMPGNRNSMAEGRSNTLGAPRMSQSTSTNSRKVQLLLIITHRIISSGCHWIKLFT